MVKQKYQAGKYVVVASLRVLATIGSKLEKARKKNGTSRRYDKELPSSSKESDGWENRTHSRVPLLFGSSAAGKAGTTH